jgi:hypothetical protein
MPGEELVITAGVGSFSKEAKPTILIDGVVVPVGDDGRAVYKTNVGTDAGEQFKKVKFTILTPAGKTITKEEIIKYNIGTPTGIIVSTDKTRVFYQGVPNPISVNSGTGTGLKKISFSVSGAGAEIPTEVSTGSYIVKFTQTGVAVVTVSDGKQTQNIKIPVKPVPPPTAYVGDKKGGVMPLARFKAFGKLKVELNNFIFEGIEYNVQSFKLIAFGKGFEGGTETAKINGASLNSAEGASILRKCQGGTNIRIEDIVVKGPRGIENLDQIMFFSF